MTYDCIVLGLGGAGSAALYHVAQRGKRVLGLDRFPIGHDRGSSHGDTRLIRKAYFEHPDYVPLLLRAYKLWKDLEGHSGKRIYTQTGLLEIGSPRGELISGTLRSAREHSIAIEEFDSAEIEARFDGFRVPEEAVGIYEHDAGYLAVEEGVRTFVDEAVNRGAETRTDEVVLGWDASHETVTIRTDRDEYTAARLIVTAGSWAADFLGDLGVPLIVLRKPLFWYRTTRRCYRREQGAPCFIFEVLSADGGSDAYYGFPGIDANGLKVAEHSRGQVVNDPLTVNRDVDLDDKKRIEAFLGQHLTGVSASCSRHVVCMYTCTPDHHFIVDRHPEHSSVAFAAGLSGHGYKFASVLGEVLADLALEGKTELPIEFLSARRFG